VPKSGFLVAKRRGTRRLLWILLLLSISLEASVDLPDPSPRPDSTLATSVTKDCSRTIPCPSTHKGAKRRPRSTHADPNLRNPCAILGRRDSVTSAGSYAASMRGSFGSGIRRARRRATACRSGPNEQCSQDDRRSFQVATLHRHDQRCSHLF